MVESHPVALERHAADAVLDRTGLAVAALHRQAAQIDPRVPLARHALVQLQEHLLDLRPLRAHRDDRADGVCDGRDLLTPEGMRHALLGEQPTATGLRPEVEVLRVGAVHRDPERQREVALEFGRVVRDEVRALRIDDQLADAPDQPRTLEDLLSQRPRRAVERRHEEKPLPRMRGDHARQQVEVVVDDARQDRQGGDVDEPGPRLPEQEQQEEKAFLVGLHGRAAPVADVDRQGRDDDDRLLVLVQPLDRLPERDEAGLELVEGRRRHRARLSRRPRVPA